MQYLTRIALLTAATASLTSPALADEVELVSGEVLEGELLVVSGEHVIFEHPVLGEITLDRADIASIDGAPAEPALQNETTEDDDATDDQQEDAKDAETAALEAESQDFFAEWDSQFSLGFSGTTGNTRTLSVNSQFRALRENELHRWLIEAAYFFAKDNGDRSQNEFSAKLTKDWLVPDSKWFYFANARYQYNEFRSWESRFGAYGGLGYEFIKRDDLEVVGRGGLGATYELEGDNADEIRPEALVGGSLIKWQITDRQTLSGSVTMYPSLDDVGEYRLDAGVEWVLQVDQADGMSIKLGLEDQYESDPGDDAKHNSLTYYGAVVLDF